MIKPASRARTLAFCGTAAFLVLSASNADGQSGDIVGTVLDEMTLDPVAGAVITLGEGRWVAESDANGNFMIAEVDAGEIPVRVSAEGYSTAIDQVSVTDAETGFVQVQLLPVTTVLNEVLVRSGRPPLDSYAEVTGLDEPMPISAAELLEKRVPGLSIRTSGSIGAATYVTIRGIKSILGSNTPLIYLDGVRIGETQGTAGGGAGIAILREIPASQVRRIRVLRGPSASARFGDSANGVILIETLRGDER